MRSATQFLCFVFLVAFVVMTSCIFCSCDVPANIPSPPPRFQTLFEQSQKYDWMGYRVVFDKETEAQYLIVWKGDGLGVCLMPSRKPK